MQLGCRDALFQLGWRFTSIAFRSKGRFSEWMGSIRSLPHPSTAVVSSDLVPCSHEPFLIGLNWPI